MNQKDKNKIQITTRYQKIILYLSWHSEVGVLFAFRYSLFEKRIEFSGRFAIQITVNMLINVNSNLHNNFPFYLKKNSITILRCLKEHTVMNDCDICRGFPAMSLRSQEMAAWKLYAGSWHGRRDQALCSGCCALHWMRR